MRGWERGGGCQGAATSFALGRRLAIVATTEGGRDGEYTWEDGYIGRLSPLGGMSINDAKKIKTPFKGKVT